MLEEEGAKFKENGNDSKVLPSVILIRQIRRLIRQIRRGTRNAKPFKKLDLKLMETK